MLNGLSLIVGLLFGLGLCLSGMNEPSKVLGFLDLAGAWDPSLAFVMAGAIAVAAPAFALATPARGADWSGADIDLPTSRKIDLPLTLGALIFGVGSELGGLCPGPGIVNLEFFAFPAPRFLSRFRGGRARLSRARAAIAQAARADAGRVSGRGRRIARTSAARLPAIVAGRRPARRCPRRCCRTRARRAPCSPAEAPQDGLGAMVARAHGDAFLVQQRRRRPRSKPVEHEGQHARLLRRGADEAQARHVPADDASRSRSSSMLVARRSLPCRSRWT